MSFINEIKSFFRMIISIFTVFFSWIFILVIVYQTIIFFKTEHYQANDTPNPKFQIAVLTDDNQMSAVYLKEFHNQRLAITKDDTNQGEDFLKQDGDTLTYHNEGALWNTESTYKILDSQNQPKIQPISFVFMTFFEAFETLALSFIIYPIAKYSFLRIWYRHSTEKTRELNQTALSQLKGLLMFIAIVVGFFTVLSFLNHF